MVVHGPAADTAVHVFRNSGRVLTDIKTPKAVPFDYMVNKPGSASERACTKGIPGKDRAGLECGRYRQKVG